MNTLDVTAAIRRWNNVKWSPRPVKDPSPLGYVDCLGFVLQVWRELGVMPEVTIPQYDFRQARFSCGLDGLLKLLEQHCFEVTEAAPADLVVAQQFKTPSHVGIYNEGYVWHVGPKGLRAFMMIGMRTRIYRLR